MYHIKKDKRSVQSGILIFRALKDLMDEKPFDAITVTELVRRADLGRATFYRNFDNIEDVLFLQCDRRFEQLVQLLLDAKKTALNGGGVAPHRLFLQFWYDDSDIIELMIKARRFDFLVRAFERVYRDLYNGGGLKASAPDCEYTPRYMEYVLSIQVGMSLGLLLKWLENGKDIPPDELADFMEQLLENTLRSTDKLIPD